MRKETQRMNVEVNGESEQCLKKVAGQMLHQRAENHSCAISTLKKFLTLSFFYDWQTGPC